MTGEHKWMTTVKVKEHGTGKNKTEEYMADTAEEALVKALEDAVARWGESENVVYEYAETWIHGLKDVSDRHLKIQIGEDSQHIAASDVQEVIRSNK